MKTKATKRATKQSRTTLETFVQKSNKRKKSVAEKLLLFSLPQNTVRTINDEKTFDGIMHAYFEEISSDWNANETLQQYGKHYKETLLPAIISVTGNRPIKDLTKDDIDKAMDIIEKKILGEDYNDPAPHIRHYRVLIQKIIKAAINHEECEDISLWGSPYSVSENETEKPHRLPKFLTPEQNAKVFFLLTHSPEMMTGEWFGLLLMYAFGLRNNEACGVTFDDIRKIGEDLFLFIYVSTKLGSSQRKQGLKTKNGYRILLVLKRIMAVINKRREHVKAWITENQDKLPEEEQQRLKNMTLDEYVGKLRIACRKFDYLSGLSSAQLSDAGRRFFQILKYDEEEFRQADIETNNKAKMAIEGYDFRDPSAYLLRRENSTTFNILNLTQSERSAYMGHTDKSEIPKSEYRTDSRRLAIVEKLEQRPVQNDLSYKYIPVDMQHLPDQKSIMPNYIFDLCFPEETTIYIEVTSDEPGDDFDIILTNSVTGEQIRAHSDYAIQEEYVGQPSVLNDYQSAFISAYDDLISDNRKKNALIRIIKQIYQKGHKNQ